MMANQGARDPFKVAGKSNTNIHRETFLKGYPVATLVNYYSYLRWISYIFSVQLKTHEEGLLLPLGEAHSVYRIDGFNIYF